MSSNDNIFQSGLQVELRNNRQPGKHPASDRAPVSATDSLRPMYARLAFLSVRLQTVGTRRWQRVVDRTLAAVDACEDKRDLFEMASRIWLPAIDEATQRLAAVPPDAHFLEDPRTPLLALECLAEQLADAGTDPIELADLTVVHQRVDVASLVRSIANCFGTLAGHRNITFEIETPGPLVSDLDPAKIEVILVNLLLNAFKHTPRDGVIRCGVHLEETVRCIDITVFNSGSPVAAGQQDAIFQRSLHADRARVFRGRWLGLGLSVSRDFARLHGGDLVVQTEKDGSAFHVTLPAYAPSRAAVPVGSSRATSFVAEVAQTARDELDAEERISGAVQRDKRALVLIVEDDRAIQRLISRCLEPTYAVACAFDGEEGLAQAQALQPDMIITDMRMPRMDGETLVKQLRAIAKGADIPILAMTALEDRPQVVRLLEVGVSDVLRKPFHHEELRARVRTMIATKKTRDILNATIGRHENNIVQLAEGVAEHQRQLERALRDLCEEKEAADRANRIKSNFLRMVSHELKTPIAAIQLHLHLLERSFEKSPTPVPGAEGLFRMGRASRRLVHLIDTVIEWARVEGGRFHVDTGNVNVGKIVRDVVDELSSQAGENGVRVEVDLPTDFTVATDARLTRLLAYNLIAYAFQSTNAGRVSISVRQDDKAAVLLVRDGAEIIAENLRQEIFSPFHFDGDLLARAGPGSGLGLHIVQDIARAVNATVELAPQDGNPGNLFALRLNPAETTRLSLVKHAKKDLTST